MGSVTYSHRLFVLLASTSRDGRKRLPPAERKQVLPVEKKREKKTKQDHLVQITSTLILYGFLFYDSREMIHIFFYLTNRYLIKGTHTYVCLSY